MALSRTNAGALTVLGAAAASLATVVLAGQSPVPQPVFKAAVNHVLVDVIATDKNDRPVIDLTSADFEIRQRGVAQTIADFERVSIPVIDRKIDLDAPLPPPPDVFTNAPPPHNARAFVFLMWTLSPANIVPIKRMMTSFVSALQPEDQVAIVYARRSDLSQDFTTDEGKLIRAVNNLKAAMGGSGIRDWLFAMHSIMQSLKAAREIRHTIVFVSEGFSLATPIPPEVLEVFRESERLNIPIYTIDPRGLTAPPLGLEGHLEDQQPNGLERIRSLERDKDGLRVLAINTNGRAFVNNWNVPQAAASLVGDNNSYYLLGFYPSPFENDGKFHDVDVMCRRPGVRIRARQGYATEGPPKPGAKSPELIDSLGAALPGGDLLLRAVVAPLAPAPKGVTSLLSVDVEYPGGVSGTDRLDLIWIAIDPDGKLRASGKNSLGVDVSASAPRVTIHDAIELPRGHLTVRVALASRLSKSSGSVHIPTEVRDFAKAKLDVAPLVIGRTPAPPGQLLEIAAGLRLVPTPPTTARAFSSGDRLRVLARVFAAKGSAVTGDMSMTMPAGEVRAIPVTRSEATDVPAAAEYVGDLSLRDLPPGRYVLAFEARDTAAKRDPVRRSTSFEVK